MNAKILNAGITICAIGCSTAVYANADFCSTPYTSISPEITQNVVHDRKKGTYSYQYRIINDRTALISINRFELQISKEPNEIHSPEKWTGELVSGVPRIPPYFVWDTVIHVNGKPEVLPSVSPGFPSWAIRSYPTYAIKPGSSRDGFSFTSERPPGIIQYRTKGFTMRPVYNSTEENDEGDPNCAGWDFISHPEDTMVTGMVIGPSEPDVISVPIRVRGEDGVRPLWPINPHKTKGKVAVLILSTRDFDASQIDPTSIQFGPGKAAPIESKIIGRRDGDDRPQEREEWEKQAVTLVGEVSRKTDRKSLLLTFDLAALEIQCVLDRAIFLRGKTLDGKNILGGATTKLLGCDVHRPDVRPDHRKVEKPRKWWKNKKKK